jgi:DNA repair protein RecN (Recombination protein N)
MLVELFIRNIAVIEEVRVRCGEGFHVLTGETGAGKSIVIDALTLVAGGRGSADLIRYGCDRAEVEAVFDLPVEHAVWQALERLGVHFEAGEWLIVRRELSTSGKSISRINGQTVNLSTLREISEFLVNIHGQHEHQSLFKTDLHIEWLDLYGSPMIAPLKSAYSVNFKEYSAVKRERKELQTKARQAAQMADLYRFQLQEIRAAKLKADEEEVLMAERKRLANAEKISAAAHTAYDALNGNQRVLESLNVAIAKLREIQKYDDEHMKSLLEQLEGAYFQTEDVALQMRDYRDLIEFNPSRLQQVESRLDLISTLKKKYGATIQDILQHEATISSALDSYENHDLLVQQLETREQQLAVQLSEQANQLSEARRKVGEQLAAQIVEQLKQLQMERTRFAVQCVTLESFQKNGTDAVEFLISANPGEPLRSLAKVASGGECSRIMLALKTIFSHIEQIPVLVFDEVDTGVSGRAAQAIAEKMAEVAKTCQVFAITHLPQVACMADVHFLIEKTVTGDRTTTQLHDLREEARVEEMARMLGGAQLTDKTRDHAREMLAIAKGVKQ